MFTLCVEGNRYVDIQWICGVVLCLGFLFDEMK